MHIKKTEMPMSWPVSRKGKRKRFIAVPSHATSKGISLLFLLRDILKIVKTRKEARYMTLNGMVKVNNLVRKDENFPVQVFDVLGLSALRSDGGQVTGDKYLRLEIVNRKFVLKEISEAEAGSKIVKISGKKILRSRIRGVSNRGVKGSDKKDKGNEKFVVQMNLDDGQNILSKVKFSVGDSVILDTKENKIIGVLPLKVGAKVEVIVGKHAGKKGELVGFEELARGRDYIIKLKNGLEIILPFKTILVIG